MFGLKQDAGWAKSPMSGLLSPKVIFTTWQTPLLKPRYWNYKKSVCKIPCNIIAHWKFIWQYVQARGNDCIPCLHPHLHLSLNPEDRWGTTNDFTTTSSIFLCSPLDFANSRPVHSLMFSSPSSSVCLVFFPLSLCLARWFQQYMGVHRGAWKSTANRYCCTCVWPIVYGQLAVICRCITTLCLWLMCRNTSNPIADGHYSISVLPPYCLCCGAEVLWNLQPIGTATLKYCHLAGDGYFTGVLWIYIQ